MAFLTDVSFFKSNNADDSIGFISKVFVNAAGDFIFTGLPDRVIRQLGSKYSHANTIPKRRAGLYISSKQAGINEIQAAIKAALKEKITSEIVLRYTFTNTCHYFIGDDGQLHPNGYATGRVSGEIDGRWNDTYRNGEHRETMAGYEIGFKASIENKKLYKSGDKQKTQYEKVSVDDEKLGIFGRRLNRFPRIDLNGDAKEIPYTEQAAEFFYKSIMGMCQIGHRIVEFFDNPNNILSATTPLLKSNED